jgi:hypothetical protein
MPVADEQFAIRDRAEFDEFWLSGIERALIQPMSLTSEPPPDPAEEGYRRIPVSVADAPVAPQVWWCYATSPPGTPVDLLIDPAAAEPASSGAKPHGGAVESRSAMSMLRQALTGGDGSPDDPALAEIFGYIAVQLTYEQMVTRLLPLTSWRPLLDWAVRLGPTGRRGVMRSYRGLDGGEALSEYETVGWFLHLLAMCGGPRDDRPAVISYGPQSAALNRLGALLDTNRRWPQFWSGLGRVTLNRTATATVSRSQRTVKVDATRSLFGVRCDGIRWAVVDSGIDARHRWFRKLNREGRPFAEPFSNDGTDANYTRVAEAYDFNRLRVSGTDAIRSQRNEVGVELPGDVPVALALGPRWYVPPRSGHGTHVAGIIGGSGGLCPDIELHDYRVLDEHGRGNEFVVVAALRRILQLTQRARQSDPAGRSRDLPIHGVNLSIALAADVTSDACGWSLVCRVCDELVRAGIVVVVSAGNTGFEDRSGALRSTGQDYRTVSITDPGNAERVITVGATDADRPREYGVSYFSARGPTADGRTKPDLVAPGIAITSAYGYRREADDRIDAEATLSGTSMAAAHVSGCAALLMARHRELIGKPEEVKRVLMESATDLHRDVNFQGAGLVDALRAVQSV